MQTSNTKEIALEQLIEKYLTGSTVEERKINTLGVAEAGAQYLLAEHYYYGEPQDYDAEYAIDKKRFWHFLERSQAEELNKLKRFADYKTKILSRLDKQIKTKGVLQLLKKGLDVDDAHLELFFFAPHENSPQYIKDNFAKNEFSITRQIRYSTLNKGEEVDMVVFLNGLAIISIELKNAWTGQTAKQDGIKQYYQRDEKQSLFNFGRCLVHFAVDTDEIYMTTKLAGEQTYFLPFNKGYNNGKGNPPNPTGHKTAYLWQEILQKKMLSSIIQHYICYENIDKTKKNPRLDEKIAIFPRYHQLDVINKIKADIAQNGLNKRAYLIQHSAGSGKSHSITWLAYQLIDILKPQLNIPLFDSVIVVTDRKLLDKQISDNISIFSEVKGIVAHADNSADLRRFLEQGKRIIITTVQKFPFIVEEINVISERNFALLIDEAHSSQSGKAADNMNIAISKSDNESVQDIEDKLAQIMQDRKMSTNALYFAFTATPKNITLEKFGLKNKDGGFEAFHTYSMKQAIEEGFILDVLANYTTYKSYYQINKSIEDNPEFDTKKAQKKLKTFVEKNPSTIAEKAQIMLEHFISKVFATKKLKAQAKAMVITQDIEAAIYYYQALTRQLAGYNHPFKIAIAFSGSKQLNGIEYSESSLNGFAETDTKDKFNSNEYRILVVANKYLTGFDQPKLCAMYVDKKLQDTLCVQALSRLNRCAPKLGKKTEDLFVLDFFNSVTDIQEAFKNYYTITTLESATDINILHDLKDELDQTNIYQWDEVEEFNRLFFNAAPAENLSPLIDQSAARFNQQLELEAEDKIDIKVKVRQFVQIYGKMAAILDFENISWEKLFWFLKFLLPKLIVKEITTDDLGELLNSVDLSTYAIERTKVNEPITLDSQDGVLQAQNPAMRGGHAQDDKETLDEIIRIFNERWFDAWHATDEDKKSKVVELKKKIEAHQDFDAKYLRNADPYTKDKAFENIVNDVMNSIKRQELELAKLWISDEAFKTTMLSKMKRMLAAGNANV